MIVQQFLLWARTAPAEHRAEAVGALARAVLSGELLPEEQREAEAALLAMLDDPSAVVRLSIAEVLAPAENAPRPLLAALLQDEGAIPALVLECSPVLTDSELIDHVALGGEAAQGAVARRAVISPGLAGAIAEVGAPSTILALLRNPGARLASVSLARIVERFGDDAAIREVLLARPDLPIEIRLALVSALSRSLMACAVPAEPGRAERWMRTTIEARERTVMALAEGAAPDAARRMVAHLRASGELTPGLILRAVLSRNLCFVQAAFVELTGLALRRVEALLAQAGTGRDALCDRAGLPRSMRPALLAALDGLQEPLGPGEASGLSRRLVARALEACTGPDCEAVASLLQRYEAEAARDEARRLVRAVVEQADLLELGADDRHAKVELVEPPVATEEAVPDPSIETAQAA